MRKVRKALKGRAMRENKLSYILKSVIQAQQLLNVHVETDQCSREKSLKIDFSDIWDLRVPCCCCC